MKIIYKWELIQTKSLINPPAHVSLMKILIWEKRMLIFKLDGNWEIKMDALNIFFTNKTHFVFCVPEKRRQSFSLHLRMCWSQNEKDLLQFMTIYFDEGCVRFWWGNLFRLSRIVLLNNKQTLREHFSPNKPSLWNMLELSQQVSTIKIPWIKAEMIPGLPSFFFIIPDASQHLTFGKEGMAQTGESWSEIVILQDRRAEEEGRKNTWRIWRGDNKSDCHNSLIRGPSEKLKHKEELRDMGLLSSSFIHPSSGHSPSLHVTIILKTILARFFSRNTLHILTSTPDLLCWTKALTKLSYIFWKSAKGRKKKFPRYRDKSGAICA